LKTQENRTAGTHIAPQGFAHIQRFVQMST